VTGGDTSYGPNSLTRIGQEMQRFVEIGFSTLEAIQSATILNAEMLRADKNDRRRRGRLRSRPHRCREESFD
jgi:imidazolonepropionase-like amidohydrolase